MIAELIADALMHIQVDDVKLFFDVEGSKLRPDGPSMRQLPTMLLLHGGPGFDHSGFKPTFSEMAGVTQVVYLDLRGTGRSDAGPTNKWSLEQWAEDVHSFCEAVSIEHPIVLGHSLGGIVAMVYATRYPDHPSKLILSSISTQPTVGEHSFAVFDRLGGRSARAAAMAFWTAPDERSLAEYEALCIPLYTRTAPPAGFYERAVRNPAMRLLFFEGELLRLDLLRQLDRIKCPTLIVAGEDDPITPVADMEEIAAAMRPDLVRLELFANAGHGVYRDRPGAFFRMLRDFIGV
jgi:proline iminopeptidase